MGNSLAVARHMTTKFRLVCFLMELTLQLQRSGMDLKLYWLLCLQNMEADPLTNQRFASFQPRETLLL